MQQNNPDDYQKAAVAQLAMEDAAYYKEQKRKASLRFWTALIRWSSVVLFICAFIYEGLAFYNHWAAGTSFAKVETWGLAVFIIFCVFAFFMGGSLRD